MTAEKSEEKTKKVRGRPFKKGSCPNPAGRPALPDELKIALRRYGEEAIRFQYDVMKGKIKAPPLARVKCSELLADRGLGKPVQGVDLNAQGGIVILLTHDTEGI